MIEQTGVVVAVQNDGVWLETEIKTTCSSCKASDGCPTSTIAKAFTPKSNHVFIQAPCLLTVGQQVKIGISETALLNASLRVYILPLMAMIMLASLLYAWLPHWHELVIFGLSCFAAVGGFWWASAYAKQPKHKAKFQPVFLGATQQAVATYKHEIPTHKID